MLFEINVGTIFLFTLEKMATDRKKEQNIKVENRKQCVTVQPGMTAHKCQISKDMKLTR